MDCELCGNEMHERWEKQTDNGTFSETILPSASPTATFDFSMRDGNGYNFKELAASGYKFVRYICNHCFGRGKPSSVALDAWKKDTEEILF